MDLLTTERVKFASIYTSIAPEKEYTILGENLIQLVESEKGRTIDQLPGLIFWKNTQGKILGCNDAMAQMFGFKSRKDLIGKTNYDLTETAYAEKVQAVDELVMATGQKHEFEEQGIVNNEMRYFISTKLPLYDENQGVVGVLGYSIDITDLRKAQEKTEKRKNAIIYALSTIKELQVPLSGIQKNVEMGAHCTELIQEYLHCNELHRLPIYLKKLKSCQNGVLHLLSNAHYHLRETTDLIHAIFGKIPQKSPEIITEKTIERYLAHNFREDIRCTLLVLEKFSAFSFLGNPFCFYRILNNWVLYAKKRILSKKKGRIFVSLAKETHFFVLRFQDTAGNNNTHLHHQLFSILSTEKALEFQNDLQLAYIEMQRIGGKIDIAFHQDGCSFKLYFPINQ